MRNDDFSIGVLSGVARRSVLESGQQLVLVCSDVRVRDLLSRTGVDRIVPVLPGIPDALGWGAVA